MDSLASVELLLAVEERFGVTLFNDERAARVSTVGDLIALLETTPVRDRL
ncbi:acyl carrier protein [Microbispora sp. RL4-1S]|uniref:Acyl carrier protein n=1 Tax=Microbispora oryzae TaxID=2806554 RepID=A0A941AJ08_9ACTN|nr:acyl carrier protein [Microbispora oryzae]